MKLTNMKLTSLLVGTVLAFCSFCVYAEESPEKTPINKDQINGRIEEAKDAVKEVNGNIPDDKVIKLEPPSNLVIQESQG